MEQYHSANQNSKKQNKEKITFKLLITEYFFKFSCDSKIANNKICPRQKHKKDDDILNQRILIPKSDTTVFGRKSSRRHCAHRMIDGVEKDLSPLPKRNRIPGWRLASIGDTRLTREVAYGEEQATQTAFIEELH